MAKPASEHEKKFAEIDELIKRVPPKERKRFRMFEVFRYTGSTNCYFPWGIDVDSSGNSYACSYMGCTLNKYDANGNQVATWGGAGNQPGRLLIPRGAAVDAAGNVYVSDGCHSTMNFNGVLYSPFDRVQKFSPSGAVLAAVGGPPGTGNGQFSAAMGVTCDTLGHVYVADSGNGQVQKFDANLNFLAEWGTHLAAPQDVACDPSGNVYVVDAGNSQVHKFDSNGNWLLSWSGPNNVPLNGPTSIAVDAHGSVYVAEGGNNRILHYNTNGHYIDTFGSQGTGNGQFEWPAGVAVDASGHNISVSDFNNHQLDRFAKTWKIWPMPMPFPPFP